MAAVGEAFRAECGDEAGPHSHGWAPHCKHCEGTRQRSPAEMRRGGEHVGKLCSLARRQSTRQSVSPSVGKLVSQSVSQSGPHPVRQHQPACKPVCQSRSPDDGTPCRRTQAPQRFFYPAALRKDTQTTESRLATCRSGRRDTQNSSIFDSWLLLISTLASTFQKHHLVQLSPRFFV